MAAVCSGVRYTAAHLSSISRATLDRRPIRLFTDSNRQETIENAFYANDGRNDQDKRAECK